VFQVLDQLDSAVAGANHTQLQGNVAVLGADRLDAGHLDSAGQNGFKVLHGQRPGEGFFVEEPVERPGLGEQLSVGRLAHQVLVALPLLGDLGDLAVQRVFAGAGFFSLLVEGAQTQAQAKGNRGQHGHGDAQALEGRPEIGVGAGGEIERDAHRLGLSCPRQRAGHAGQAQVAERRGPHGQVFVRGV
jgi:hypothetical protein